MERDSTPIGPSIERITDPSRDPSSAGPGNTRRDPWPVLVALGVLALIALGTFLALRGVPSAAERALAEAEALAAGGDHLAARDAFLEVARAGGELAGIALERARESGAIYVEAATVRLDQLLAEERTAEALVHLQDTLAELRDTPEVAVFLEGARELTSELSAQLGPALRTLVEVLRDAASG
jgi:hypothetical protein